ncbi:MAG: carboxypeptidase-like regulatory domain-containing protein [Candidatus Thermoplasmatota archaeon]
MKEKRLIKFVWKEEKGAIEGLPLYLLIMVVIAAVGIGIVMYWMSSVKKMGPKVIGAVEVSPDRVELVDCFTGGTKKNDNIYGNPDIDVIVFVKDADGNPINGATVKLDGCSITTSDGKIVYGTTGKDGKKTFDNLKIEDYVGTNTGEVKVIVSKSGYTAPATPTTIVVIPVGPESGSGCT